ncbi:hypothetical protein [Nocardia africana]|uniref:Uncharacterized protein n=1 Tax=Nocardia africana TaxID=134964 RepID=A0ABW6NRI9_9NOCA
MTNGKLHQAISAPDRIYTSGLIAGLLPDRSCGTAASARVRENSYRRATLMACRYPQGGGVVLLQAESTCCEHGVFALPIAIRCFSSVKAGPFFSVMKGRLQ